MMAGSGSVPPTNVSGWQKSILVRIRIRNTDFPNYGILTITILLMQKKEPERRGLLACPLGHPLRQASATGAHTCCFLMTDFSLTKKYTAKEPVKTKRFVYNLSTFKLLRTGTVTIDHVFKIKALLAGSVLFFYMYR
jgi:hypothetical protein